MSCDLLFSLYGLSSNKRLLQRNFFEPLANRNSSDISRFVAQDLVVQCFHSNCDKLVMEKIYEMANGFIPAARWLHVLYGRLSCLTFAAIPKPTFLYIHTFRFEFVW